MTLENECERYCNENFRRFYINSRVVVTVYILSAPSTQQQKYDSPMYKSQAFSLF